MSEKKIKLAQVKKEMEKANEFENMTPSEIRLVEVLLNPENIGLTVVEKCKKADISPMHYYRMMKNSEYVKKVHELTLNMIKGRIADVIQASLECALNDKYKGFADRKMLLEMSGMYRQSSDLNINNNLSISASISRIPQQDLQVMIQDYITDNPKLIEMANMRMTAKELKSAVDIDSTDENDCFTDNSNSD